MQQANPANVFRGSEGRRKVWFMVLESKRQGKRYDQIFQQL